VGAPRLARLFIVATCASACSKGTAPGATEGDGGTLPPGIPAMMAAPSPFSVEGARAPEDTERFGAKLAALAWETLVHEEPRTSSKVLGYIRAGGIVAAAVTSTVVPALAGRADGHCEEWRAVSPVGYVCLEPNNATLDLQTPLVVALSHRPDPDERLPYMYGIARRNGPLYSRLPTRAEAENSEWHLQSRMRRWLAAEDGAAFRYDYWLRGKSEPSPPALELWQTQATREVPDWLAGGKLAPGNLSGLKHHEDLVVGTTVNHNGFALLDTVVLDGRRYGITTDLLVVPVDRLRPIEGSDFHGFRIPEDVDFPFALVRRDGAPLFVARGRTFVKSHDVARRGAVRLTGQQRVADGVFYFEASDGTWLSDRFVSRVDGTRRMPKWAVDGERWIDVSVRKQVLVAYEGTKPVYATLVSTGEAGLEDPETTKSTVLGSFRIYNKHVTTTMSSEVVGEEFELKDIPYVQYFEGGYALHAAYWHDDFGTPHSHGCINLSPEDAKWLFGWTEPQLPRGWHGVRTSSLSGTVVNVHR
jgi:hypothetical protein